jgi:hypothetical protein
MAPIDPLQTMKYVLGDLEKELKEYKLELDELRAIVYPKVTHVDGKTRCDYAEIGFIIPQSYIMRSGVYVLVERFLEVMSRYLQPNSSLFTVPALSRSTTVNESYTVSFLVVASCKVDFAKACQDFATSMALDGNVVLFGNDLLYSLASFESAQCEFHKNFMEFTSLSNMVYFEVRQDGTSLQHTGMLSIESLIDSEVKRSLNIDE